MRFGGFKISNKYKLILGIIGIIIAIIVIIILLKDFFFETGSQGSNLFFYVAIPIIFTILAPFIYNWFSYRFSTPKFSVCFKPAIGKTYEEKHLQEIELVPDREQLVWIILRNEGKVIKENWFCNIDFEKGFMPIPIEETIFKDVDFQKKYTVQKKYNVASFNSQNFSPLFPYDEDFYFPIVVKTSKDEKEYNVTVTVRTGNHRNKFRHTMKIKIQKIEKIKGINNEKTK